MEKAGAVLLPNNNCWLHYVGIGGGGYEHIGAVYWSYLESKEVATHLHFFSTKLNTQNSRFDLNRNYRLAVRLVHDAD